jgi:glycosyltransferase involved in cell wall biosynthesis
LGFDFRFFTGSDRWLGHGCSPFEDFSIGKTSKIGNLCTNAMPHANPLIRLGWQLPWLYRKCCLNILHTQYVMPFWPLRGKAVTIHDVLYEQFPQYFSSLFVLRSRALMRWSARKADMLFTVSEYSRSEIAAHYGVNAHSIGVLYNAVDSARFFPGADGLHHVELRGLKSRDYILTVGRIEPRKNHASILRAYARLEGLPPPLVIIGQRDFGYGAFDEALATMPSTHRIIVLSDVDDEELPAFYRHALVFLYPSFAEGFGMPPLESLASGTPVITSSTTAIPEIVGDAGLLVDPADEIAIHDALASVLKDDALRSRLIEKGLNRSAQFSWRRSAETLATAYHDYLKEA